MGLGRKKPERKPEADESRYKRAQDKGDRAGSKARTVLAIVAALGIGIAAFGGQVFTWLAAGALDLIGFVGVGISVAALGVAGAVRRSSDEPRERIAWSVAIGLVLLFLVVKLGWM